MQDNVFLQVKQVGSQLEQIWLLPASQYISIQEQNPLVILICLWFARLQEVQLDGEVQVKQV